MAARKDPKAETRKKKNDRDKQTEQKAKDWVLPRAGNAAAPPKRVQNPPESE
jgi:hypothetical protein